MQMTTVGHLLVTTESETSAFPDVAEGVVAYSTALQCQSQCTTTRCREYLHACIAEPEGAMNVVKVDPVVRYVSTVVKLMLNCADFSVVSWCGHRSSTRSWSTAALRSSPPSSCARPCSWPSGQHGISRPRWLLRRCVTAFTLATTADDGADEGAESHGETVEDTGVCVRDVLRVGTSLSTTITELLLAKSFLVLNVWSGEPRLTSDCVRMIVACIDSTDRIKGRYVAHRVAQLLL